MPKLYRRALSGHSHRAQLFLSSLGEKAELADVGGYSDIAHAPEGGVDLEPFTAVRA